MNIVVLGAGAVGAYYGGQLARAGHEVTCFARGATLAALRARGLEIRTPEGAFQVGVAATDRVEALGPADFAIVAVKSYSLAEIGPVVRHCARQGTTVVPLLKLAVQVEPQSIPAGLLVMVPAPVSETLNCTALGEEERFGVGDRLTPTPLQPFRVSAASIVNPTLAFLWRRTDSHS